MPHVGLQGPLQPPLYFPMPFRPETVPSDILYIVLEQLTDRRDWHAAALASWSFNRAATPLLYRTIDTDTRTRRASGSQVLHPAFTLLRKPDLARYVRHIHETSVLHASNPEVTSTILDALRLCTSLHSFAWMDDTSSSPAVFMAFLDVLKGIPFRALTLRTYSDLGEPTWTVLNTLSGLQKISVWSMDGPPRVLQGWAGQLGSTLKELELGRCAGVPASILISVLSQLPLLRDLRLKGAPSAAIPDILTCLPNLVSLDTEYLGSGILRPSDDPLPPLKRLTVRTSSVDLQGPVQLWSWLRQLIPRPSLEGFVLNAFSTQGQTTIPRHFLLSLARTHGETLKQFLVNMTQLTLEDIHCICTLFPNLEELSCAVASPDAESIERAIAKGHNLRCLKLHVHWLPNSYSLDDFSPYSPNSPSARFGKSDAEALMMREGSRIRTLSMGPHVYSGSWMPRLDANGRVQLDFEIVEDTQYYARGS
ncbi:hypothetical protein BV25DRAFT_1846723 [Artomyces pyxidatus]|uniref:Uncharacterized protein n=1 Tax=Artomyces pyxidatus TaxID=48021 RepID=A0ACB8TGR8_9AGAM|nr:hypothetical protein BV25DRAFT_1846723 [Artomyces pyxidatus]